MFNYYIRPIKLNSFSYEVEPFYAWLIAEYRFNAFTGRASFFHHRQIEAFIDNIQFPMTWYLFEKAFMV